MNLQRLRTLFVEKSGRYDLVTGSGADNGANYFIQCGSRFLDRHSRIRNTQLGYSVWNVGSSGVVKLPECWLIHEVSVSQHGKWWPVHRIKGRRDPKFIIGRWSAPVFYLVHINRKLPVSTAKSEDEIEGRFDVSGLVNNLMSIELLPHPKEPTVCEVRGKYYSEPLVADGDTNVWSVLYPDILLKAALYELEVYYRNTEGAKDWLNSIQLDLTDAEQMDVEADIQHKDVMGL